MPHNNIDSTTIEAYDGGYGVFAWSGNKLVKSFFTKSIEVVPRKPKRKIKWKNLLIWRNIKLPWRKTKRTPWTSFNMWGDMAEKLEKHLTSGRKVYIQARQPRLWEKFFTHEGGKIKWRNMR